MTAHDPLNDARPRDSSQIDAAGAAAGAAVGGAMVQPSSLLEPAPLRPRRRWWRVLTWGVPIAALTATGLLLGVYVYLISTTLVGSREGRRPIPQAFAWPLRLQERVNVLLMGVDVTLDNRRRVLNVARADTLVLVSFDHERRRIAAMSIPRDTRAEIPGYGTQKINASYAYGGPGLTITSVEQLTGVKVHFFVKMGPESFTHIIDALGGIEVDVEKDMKYTDSWAGYTIDLRKGVRRLSGSQATGYIRFRHDALGDIGRVERQRQVMHALLRELRKPSTVLATPRLLQAFAQNTQTNLNNVELMTLGVFALRGAQLQEYTLPGTFAPQFWEPDVAKMRQMIADLYFGVTLDDLAHVNIEIINGSGIPGLGWQVAARLQGFGFRSVKVRQTAPAQTTRVIDRAGRRQVARMVASTLKKATIVTQGQSGNTSITVILGRDLRGGTQSTMVRRISPP